MGVKILHFWVLFVIVIVGLYERFSAVSEKQGGEGIVIALSQPESAYQSQDLDSGKSVRVDFDYCGYKGKSSTIVGESPFCQCAGAERTHTSHVCSVEMQLRKYMQSFSSVLLGLWHRVVLQPAGVHALEIGGPMGRATASVTPKNRMVAYRQDRITPQMAIGTRERQRQTGSLEGAGPTGHKGKCYRDCFAAAPSITSQSPSTGYAFATQAGVGGAKSRQRHGCAAERSVEEQGRTTPATQRVAGRAGCQRQQERYQGASQTSGFSSHRSPTAARCTKQKTGLLAAMVNVSWTARYTLGVAAAGQSQVPGFIGCSRGVVVGAIGGDDYSDVKDNIGAARCCARPRPGGDGSRSSGRGQSGCSKARGPRDPAETGSPNFRAIQVGQGGHRSAGVSWLSRCFKIPTGQASSVASHICLRLRRGYEAKKWWDNVSSPSQSLVDNRGPVTGPARHAVQPVCKYGLISHTITRERDYVSPHLAQLIGLAKSFEVAIADHFIASFESDPRIDTDPNAVRNSFHSTVGGSSLHDKRDGRTVWIKASVQSNYIKSCLRQQALAANKPRFAKMVHFSDSSDVVRCIALVKAQASSVAQKCPAANGPCVLPRWGKCTVKPMYISRAMWQLRGL